MSEGVIPDGIEAEFRELVIAYATRHGEANTRAVMAKLFGKNTAAAVWAELFPAPAPQPAPAPVPGPLPQSGRLTLVGSLTYAWPAAVRADTIASELEAIAAAGRAAGVPTGITMELQGLEARLGADSKDWKRSFAQCCEWAPEVISTALNRGLSVLLFVWNTNTPGKGYKPSWKAGDVAGNKRFIVDAVTDLLERLPNDPRLLIAPFSETDSSTDPSINADLAALCRKHVPAERLVATASGTSWAKWVDRHPQKLGHVHPQSDNTIITSDSNIIGELFEGGTWGTTPKPIVARCAQFARENQGAGILAFYTTGSVPTAARYQAEWLEVLKASRKGAVTPGTEQPGTGPKIVEFRPYSKGTEARIEFKLSGIEGWPVKIDPGNGKRLKGWIEINGVLVESFKEGQTDQHLGNAWGSDEHGINIQPGQPARFRFVSRDKRQATDTRTIPWPWRAA